MMQGFLAGYRSDHVMYLHGVTEPIHPIIEFLLQKDGLFTIVKSPGHTGWMSVGRQGYYPTSYELDYLVPDGSKRRTKLEGEYRVQQSLCSVHPGRQYRKALRELKEAMLKHAAGVKVDFKAIRDRYPYK